MDGNLEQELSIMLERVQCVTLPREDPELVNYCQTFCPTYPTIIVCQDEGEGNLPISEYMVRIFEYLVPNEIELERLVQSSCKIIPLPPSTSRNCDNNGADVDDDDENDNRIHENVSALQRIGASNALVT
jgi:hypothetical protein